MPPDKGILKHMNYEFSLGSFFFGLMIIIAGAVFMRFHQWVADNFGGGLGSYDRYKLYALITVIVGFLVMTNLHVVILRFLLGFVFPGLR